MTSAIYNEIDAFPAQWLRNLIAAGHVAPGAVDERSIVDLTADDVSGPGQRHFFAGIGVWSHALRLAGVSDDADVWTASCPCQPFSGAGRKGGFADERHLWPHLFRLVEERRPPILFGEQVASADGLEWLDAVSADLERAGYTFGAADTCAAGVGAPHIRQRLYFVAYADDFDGRLHVPGRQPGRENAQACGRCETGDVADADGAGPQDGRTRWPALDGGADGARPTDDRGTRGLVDARGARGRRNARADARAEAASSGARSLDRRVGDEPRATGADGWLADADLAHAVDGDESRGRRLVQPSQDAVTGFWSACDWIRCTDGKSRPVEPGTQPLAHGIVGRVGRLRAYGNAIVAQQAATFIKAAIGAWLDAAEH